MGHFCSGRVWSLWDMLEPFRNREIIGAVSYLAETRRKLQDVSRNLDGLAVKHRGQTPEYVLADSEMSDLPNCFRNLILAGEKFEIPGIASAAQEALAAYEQITADGPALDRNDVSQLSLAITGLHSTFMHVIKDTLLLHVGRDAVRYYSGDRLGFGQEVEDAFPSSTNDAREASRCRALERWTACVMHCMRALEPALLALGDSVGVKLPRPEWWKVIKEINIKVESAKNAGKHDALKFESEAASYFRDIKDGWRNHTMHAKMSFGEDDAIAAYDATRSLMRHLSKELSETP